MPCKVGMFPSTYYTYDTIDRLTGACNLLTSAGLGLSGTGDTKELPDRSPIYLSPRFKL
jgi:hypothetical protein